MNALCCLLVAIYLVYVQGGELYNPYTEQCCGGAIFKIEDKARSCCGSTPYNNKEKVCCGVQLFEYPTENSTSYACCYDQNTEQMSAYDPMGQVCCNGEVVDKEVGGTNMYYACCGNDLFLHHEKICCAGELYDRTDYEMQCCADNVRYNSSSQLCCAAYTISSDNKLEINFELHDIENYQNRYQTSCCGSGKYNTSSEYCCWETQPAEVRPRPDTFAKNVNPQCCGKSYITNYNTELCKDGEVFSRPSTSHYFCGDELVDGRKEGCCSGEPFEYNAEIQCCHSANKTYNFKTESCCGDEVLPITDRANNRTACCFDYLKFYGSKHQRLYQTGK